MDISEEFEQIPATCASDATKGLNNLNPSIKPLQQNHTIVGRAFPVKIPAGDNLGILRALKEASPGDILVVDGKGETYRAIAGDFVIGMMKTMNLGGFVVDGAVRDAEDINNLDFPVFCKGTTAAASNKAEPGEINVPISCGGVAVHPGDIIIGDSDGVVVVLKDQEEEILAKAKQKLDKDAGRDEKVKTPEDVVAYIDSVLKQL